jgi:YidC/Oxa1 family membrane protein insertase
MFEPLFDALGAVMNFFYSLVPSYGLAIMGLTVLVMVLITPLTVKSTRSMLQMQRLQPEMKRIQEKYKNDREKLNAELMAFYKENQINPLGGCLPLIAQMPVFIIMYQLMRGLTVRPGGLGTGLGQIAGQSVESQTLTPWVFTDQNFQPSHLDPDWEMYEALSNTNDMNFFGMDLSLSASDALRIGLLVAIPFFVLLGIMLVTGIVQNRQLQSRNTNASANPQQQAIMKFMPFFLPVISFGFPAGLALYWCTQNLCRIGTNQYITHSIYSKQKHDGPIETTGKEKSSKDSTGKQAKAVGKSSGGDDSSDNGSAKQAKSKSAKGGSSKNGSKGDAGSSKGPGKSIKSQKAHEKASGSRPSGSPSKGGSSSGRRRSGERRRNS